MKKLLALVLVLAMVATLFVGCAEKNEGETTAAPGTEAPKTEAPATEAPKTEAPVEEDGVWSVIGTLNGTNWDTDFDMTFAEGYYTYGPVELTAGTELKCRKDHDWAVNMGSNGPDGDNVVVEADGTYNVVLDLANNTVILNGTGSEPTEIDASMKVAFVTDVGNIDDHSFNQYTYEGVTRFGDATGCKVTYYKPAEDTDQSREDAINQAIADGYNTIVMAGYLFGPACNACALAHPEVNFLALDVSEFDLKADSIPSNVSLIVYKEEQCGYLAGYAAVIDGYEELGFLGGMSVPAVVRYGQGFVQGANAAAEKLGKTVNIKYWYSGVFAPNDEIVAKMDTWYVEGTEIVFACGGGIYLSCLSAADANDGLMIGVDVDQSNESDCIITSAMKALSNSVMLALTECGKNGWTWPEAYAGTCQSLGAESDCVGLPMETSKFTTFTKENYDELYKGIVDGTIEINNNSDPDVHPETPNANVDWQ